jgi:hypothetical protein
VDAGDSVLDPVNVQATLGQLDLLPLQVADLRRPQTVAIGDQDHGRIAMPVAAMLSGAVDEPLDLALGEVAPLTVKFTMLGVRFLDVDFMRETLPARLLLYRLYTFIEQSIATALGIAAHRPMLVSLDEWAASSAATIEIIQFPCETPGGGGLLDFQNRFLPLLQKPGRKPFLRLSN